MFINKIYNTNNSFLRWYLQKNKPPKKLLESGLKCFGTLCLSTWKSLGMCRQSSCRQNTWSKNSVKILQIRYSQRNVFASLVRMVLISSFMGWSGSKNCVAFSLKRCTCLFTGIRGRLQWRIQVLLLLRDNRYFYPSCTRVTYVCKTFKRSFTTCSYKLHYV